MSEKQEEVKKPGFFQRTKKSVKMSFGEFKKVHWPTKQEVATYTGVVLASVAVVALMIWVVDSGVTALFGLVLK